MSEAVLISIQPQWCEKIARGEKTIEVRKNRPKIETPFKCYIYCTNKRPYLVWGDVFRGNWETEFTHISGYSREEAEKIWDVFNGKVIGEFICDSIEEYHPDDMVFGEYIIDDDTARTTRLTAEELWAYGHGAPLYGWHISDLVIYDKPKELGEFYKTGTLSASDFECQLYDGSGAPSRQSYASYLFTRAIRRPPQSWCYVEEVQP